MVSFACVASCAVALGVIRHVIRLVFVTCPAAASCSGAAWASRSISLHAIVAVRVAVASCAVALACLQRASRSVVRNRGLVRLAIRHRGIGRRCSAFPASAEVSV